MWQSFREFLDFLAKERELVNINKDVDPKFETSAYIRKSCDVKGPAFLFSGVKGFSGWRYAAAIYATRKRVALGMNCTEESQILQKFNDAVSRQIPPRVVNHGQCQEVIMKGENIDISKIPVAWHSERDAGYFITSAVEIAKDPDSGVRLVGIHRLQVRDRKTLAFWGPAEKRIGRAFLKSQDRGKPLQIAITIGNEPSVDLASQARVSHDVDKLGIAGGLKGDPIELVKCKTIDLEVPKNVEVVIEGEIIPNSAALEGPFGELTGVYSGTTNSPSINITAITMRSDPIMHTVLTGMPPSENGNMLIPGMVQSIYRIASFICPEVKAVNVTGNSIYTVLISIKKRHDGESWNIISGVLGSLYPTKYCYVFDEDINIFNPQDVEWAFQTRMQPDKDAHIFPSMVGAPLNPKAQINRHSSKIGFDCTIPLNADRRRFEKVTVPGSEKVTW